MIEEVDSLRICHKCDCRLCFESAAEVLTPSTWLVALECPNCWHAWTSVVTNAALELLEYTLDDEMRVIAEELQYLEYANALAEANEWEAEIARFTAALEADAILPIDF